MWGFALEKFDSKNSLSPSEGGSQGGSRNGLWRQLPPQPQGIASTTTGNCLHNHSHTSYLFTYEDGTDRCSEMLAFKLQMPVNNQEESIRHSEYGGSLKSRNIMLF
jgi:hypothetical protein